MDILGTDLALDETALVTDFVNLYATTPSGQQIKSSTFHLIGDGYNLALGINFDYTSLVYANRILVDLMSAEADLQSAMWRGGDSQLSAIFDECLSVVGKPVSALTKKDRMKIIALLDQKNAFSFRKSVPFVARRLQVSPVHGVQIPGRADRRRGGRGEIELIPGQAGEKEEIS